MSKPVLEAIRAILKFKDYATISEIAEFAGITRRAVIEAINANDKFLMGLIGLEGDGR